jgi:hypothetical protein
MATTVSDAAELQAAVDSAGPGSEIVAGGGTYGMSSRWVVRSGGESGNPLVIRAAEGERPQIQFAADGSNDSDSGVQFRSPYVVFRGFEVSGSGWKGVNTEGNAHDVVLEGLRVHNSHLWGIMNNGRDDVVFRNCDSYDNMGGDGDNSDGINMTGPAQNGLIEGCRSWNNGDDGFDFWVSDDHTVRNCMAWNNGRGSGGDGNGFKLGGGSGSGGHLVHNCVSFANRNRGFDWNVADREMEVYNCTSINDATAFRFLHGDRHILKNNVAVGGAVRTGSEVVEEANSWNLGLSDSDIEFVSLDPTSGDFAKPIEDSPLIGAGVDVGLAYAGDAPDLGAFEYQGSSSSGEGRLPVDGAVTLPVADADHDSESVVQSEHDGYTGDGYVNFIPRSGGYVRWPLAVATAGDFEYEIRYANGGSSDRTVTLSAGDSKQQVTFPRTGDWTAWSTVTGSVTLPDGDVTLSLETIGQDGGNVDYLALSPVENDGGDGGDGSTNGTANHGYAIPDQGQDNWHVPLNDNFRAIDRDVPIVDAEGNMAEYAPRERTLYVALDSGSVYVGDGSAWNQLGRLD